MQDEEAVEDEDEEAIKSIKLQFRSDCVVQVDETRYLLHKRKRTETRHGTYGDSGGWGWILKKSSDVEVRTSFCLFSAATQMCSVDLDG
ncbi:hypothetical protein Tco_0745794 [Tanacetum coccineum]